MSLEYLRGLPYDFEPHDPLTPFLAVVIDRERAKAAPVEANVAPLVSGLAQRLQKKQAQLDLMKEGEQWAVGAKEAKKDPLEYMELCRTYLAKMDTQGWNRSYHQRLFHDDFLKACTRSFWKLEKSGQFARDHQKLLRVLDDAPLDAGVDDAGKMDHGIRSPDHGIHSIPPRESQRETYERTAR